MKDYVHMKCFTDEHGENSSGTRGNVRTESELIIGPTCGPIISKGGLADQEILKKLGI